MTETKNKENVEEQITELDTLKAKVTEYEQREGQFQRLLRENDLKYQKLFNAYATLLDLYLGNLESRK